MKCGHPREESAKRRHARNNPTDNRHARKSGAEPIYPRNSGAKKRASIELPLTRQIKPTHDAGHVIEMRRKDYVREGTRPIHWGRRRCWPEEGGAAVPKSKRVCPNVRVCPTARRFFLFKTVSTEERTHHENEIRCEPHRRSPDSPRLVAGPCRLRFRPSRCQGFREGFGHYRQGEGRVGQGKNVHPGEHQGRHR